MRKIGIISRCDRDEILSHVEKIIDHLKSRVDVLVDPKTAQKLTSGRHSNGRHEKKWR